MRLIRSGAVVVALCTTVGCASPEVTPLQEGDITSAHFDEDSLAGVRLADGVDQQAFTLAAVPVGRDFDRVGVLWESYEAGGGTSVEVAADGGSFRPIVVDFQEFVPETGITLFAGHVDVGRSADKVTARVTLFRDPEANSPHLASLKVDAFVFADVAEVGTAFDPSTVVPETPAVAQPSIVTREQWNARAPKCSGAAHSPYRMTFHQTVTPNGETGSAAKARMRQMQAYHQDSNGWCDIGYHFSIDAAGVIYRGRTTTANAGSHVGGQNQGNIGISLMGTYDTVPAPDAQLSGLMDAFAWIADVYDIAANGTNIRGHQEWPGQSTSCPGAKVLPKKSLILSGIADRLAGIDPDPEPPPAPSSIIVDNVGTSFTSATTWWTSASQSDRYATDYKVRETAQLSDPAEWKATIPATRNYEVFVWYSQGSNRATEAPYFVYHQGGTTKKVVNQRENGGRWVSLGTYSFAAGTSARVALSCWTNTGTYVIADAVKLEPR